MSTIATLSSEPSFIETDGTDLYVSLNHKIVKVTLAGVETLIAGGETSGSSDGNGSSASFHQPKGMLYLNNKLYVADYANMKVRVIDLASNEVTTFLSSASFPNDITTDGTYMYLTSYNLVRKILLSDSSQVSLIGLGSGYVDGDATTARFNMPSGIKYYNGNVYIFSSHAF